MSTGAGVQNGESCIDMPSVWIDSKCEVHFRGLNSTNVEALFPWICFCGSPRSTHTDYRMGPNGKIIYLRRLRSVIDYSRKAAWVTGCYRIAFIKTQVNKARTKWAQIILHESQGISAGPISNEDLSKSISSWAKHREVSSMRGCPTGLTVGPCNKWQERMWTSFGRWALTDVWPATITFTFVASIQVSWHLKYRLLPYWQGPYCTTTRSMNSASTEYMM